MSLCNLENTFYVNFSAEQRRDNREGICWLDPVPLFQCVQPGEVDLREEVDSGDVP